MKGEPYGGFTLTEPPAEGMAFDGWYTLEGNRITADTIVERDYVVTSRWREIQGYEILSLQALDSKDQTLDGIPDEGFYLSAEVYKSAGAGRSVLLLVTYDQKGKMQDTYFMKAGLPEKTTCSLGVWVKNELGQVAQCRAFVLDSLADPTPLCKAAVLEKA